MNEIKERLLKSIKEKTARLKKQEIDASSYLADDLYLSLVILESIENMKD